MPDNEQRPAIALKNRALSTGGSVLAFIVLGLLQGGCTRGRPALPSPDAELIAAEMRLQYEEAAEFLIDDHKRLLRVGSRLLVANAQLCQRQSPFVGLITVSRADLREAFRGHEYWAPLQEVLMRRYEIGDSVKVLYVLPDSPAARSGVLSGDVLWSAVPPAEELVTESSDKSNQPLRFQIGRIGEVRTVDVDYVSQCAYSFQRVRSDDIAARSEGTRIYVTTGMLRFAADDDDLATILGHELAHHILEYLEKYGTPRTTETRLRDEREADHLGVYLAARAGFDISGTAAFWRRWARTNPEMISDRWSEVHPSTAERVVRLEVAVAEVQEKLRNGQPLLPNGMWKPEP